MNVSAISSRKAAMIACHDCHLLCRAPENPGAVPARCPRCHARLHTRKVNSISRTWAFSIAAALFYLPANLLPITHTVQMGLPRSDTIISGVLYFIKTGMWGIALIIFVASILIPLLKLVVLFYLLISVHCRSSWRPRDRTRLFRITEAIGRWSMVDIFAVTILVGLVKLGVVAEADAGQGALFFAAVVITTMLAAMSFDPRLIWDALESDDA
ncbi:MAG: paraquat-inducible membrane protein A [Deltaproteobacteria bacterium]|nr:MAG: paraquat-inducible membrane protein A [Deltaproteobacteria bacterium]